MINEEDTLKGLTVLLSCKPTGQKEITKLSNKLLWKNPSGMVKTLASDQ